MQAQIKFGICTHMPYVISPDSPLRLSYICVTGRYIFALSFLLLSFYLFSSRNLSGCRLDAYHTSTHGVALVRCEFIMQV